jgi:hypothetical protein
LICFFVTDGALKHNLFFSPLCPILGLPFWFEVGFSFFVLHFPLC